MAGAAEPSLVVRSGPARVKREGGGVSREEKRRLTEAAQEREVERSRMRRDRLLAAIHRLEGRLAAAAPGREREWVSTVNQALSDLREAMEERIDSGDGLLSDIELSAPHLWARVKRLRTEYVNLERQVGELLAEFRDVGEREIADFRDIRERVGWLLTALRHQQSRETDLIFEVYNRDTGVCD